MKPHILALPLVLVMLAAPPALASMAPTPETLTGKVKAAITALAPGGTARSFERAECQRTMPLEAQRIAQAARDKYCGCVADFMARSGQGGPKAETGNRRYDALWQAGEDCGYYDMLRAAQRAGRKS